MWLTAGGQRAACRQLVQACHLPRCNGGMVATSSLPCQVSFIMPSQYTKETLPKPGGSGVHLVGSGPTPS